LLVEGWRAKSDSGENGRAQKVDRWRDKERVKANEEGENEKG
jgi:hypothetical protein